MHMNCGRLDSQETLVGDETIVDSPLVESDAFTSHDSGVHCPGQEVSMPLVKRVQFGSLELDEVQRVVDIAKLTATFEFGSKWECTTILSQQPRNAALTESTSCSFPTEAIPTVSSNNITPQPNDRDDTTASLPSLPTESAKPTTAAPMSWAKIATAKVDPILKSAKIKLQWAKPTGLVPIRGVKIAPPKINPSTQKIGLGSVGSTMPSIIATTPHSIESFFSSFEVLMKPRNIKPCGLKNHGNMCFMNAVLQPLLHCTPFYNVIQQLQRVVPKQKTPLFNAFCTFFDKFEKNYSSSTKSKRSFLNALDAEDIYDALRTKSSVHFKKGGQEDAEEFLRFILDELHEELLHARQSAYNSKMATTLLTEVTESPIMQIFGGKMRTILKAFGEKDKAMLEPFMGLPLDIAPDFVSSIEDGLLNFTAPEVISGYKTGTGSTVDLTKQSFMDSFPRVLIVHLKRFVFDAKIGTTQKLRKHIRFSTVLKIHPDVASPARREENQSLEYKLLAVVNHHGKCAEGGHYTCDVYRKKNEWLHIDDEHVENISEAEAEMTKERDDRQAYMLFYSKV